MNYLLLCIPNYYSAVIIFILFFLENVIYILIDRF